jgi:hypothetical protein
MSDEGRVSRGQKEECRVLSVGGNTRHPAPDTRHFVFSLGTRHSLLVFIEGR